MYKTHIFTKFSAITLKSKLIFNGMLPFIPHKGMGLDITPDQGTEMVRDVSYDIGKNSVCVIIESPDPFNNYAEVPLDVPEKPVITGKYTFLDYFKELQDCLTIGTNLTIEMVEGGFVIELLNKEGDVLAKLKSSDPVPGFEPSYCMAPKYDTEYWIDILDTIEHLNDVWEQIEDQFIP